MEQSYLQMIRIKLLHLENQNQMGPFQGMYLTRMTVEINWKL